MNLMGYFQLAARAQGVSVVDLVQREPIRSDFKRIVELTSESLTNITDRQKIEEEIKEREDSLILALKMLT